MGGSRIINNPFSRIIKIHDKMFQLRTKIPLNQINMNKVENNVGILKEHYHCDTLFKAQGYLWLCNEIIDIEYEEISN